MDRLIDEIVEVRVTDAAAAAASTSVNTVAVFGLTSKQDAKVSVELNLEHNEDGDSVEDHFGKDSDLYKVAETFFKEENNTGRLVCIPFAIEPTAENVDAENVDKITVDEFIGILESALSVGKDDNKRDVDFYHVVLRLSSSMAAEDIKAVAEALQDWCAKNYKVAHVEIQDRAVAKAVASEYAGDPLKRVYFYFHKEENGRSLAAALVADRCSKDPARGTWAHKTLTSVNPDATTKANLVDAQDNGLNIYCTVAGVNRTFFGSAAGGKYFIDEQIKKDWLRFRTQEAVFNILGSANNGDGVDFNDAGIGAIASAINNIFTIAADNEHRYILPDSFDVQVPKYADIPKDDKDKRNLPAVKVSFAIQASIHTVKYIELQVVSA